MAERQAIISGNQPLAPQLRNVLKTLYTIVLHQSIRSFRRVWLWFQLRRRVEFIRLVVKGNWCVHANKLYNKVN